MFRATIKTMIFVFFILYQIDMYTQAVVGKTIENKSLKGKTAENVKSDNITGDPDVIDNNKKEEHAEENKNNDPVINDENKIKGNNEIDKERSDREKLEKDKSDAEKSRKDQAEKIEKEKAEKETIERAEKDRHEREQLEKEKLEKERLEKEQAKKKKVSKEYIALFFGYGGSFPVADYGARFRSAHQFSGTAGVYCLNLYGLSPELHVRYAKMGSKSDPTRFSSSLTMLDMFPAIVYRYNISLPRNTLTVYGRIFDGVSRVGYTSRNPYYPIIEQKIVEYINIFGFSAGCYYDVWHGLLVGINMGYSIIFTAGSPLQSVSVGLNVGWRIL